MEFLELLKEQDIPWVTIWDAPPSDWIKKEHIGKLMKHIESKDRAAFVISPKSSYLPSGSSTVGDEAMYLIEGYKLKKYPPGLYSGPGDIKETREWYNVWSKENNVP